MEARARMVLRPRPFVYPADIGEETVLLDAVTSEYYGLLGVTRQVWVLVSSAEGSTREELIDRLMQLAENPRSEIEAWVDESITSLLDLGLVVDTPS